MSLSMKSSYVSEDDYSQYGNDEEDKSIKYIIENKEYYAEVIPLRDDGYMIMPFGRVKHRTNDEYNEIEQYLSSIDIMSGNIIKDIIVDDLATACQIVSGERNMFLAKEKITYI